MKKQYRFEILRRGDGRYYWLFVVLERRRRRVLARSTRDYRSAEKAKGAIAKLLRTTNVFDTTGDLFPLPATHFRIVPGVVPLMVEEFPVLGSEAEEFRPMPRPLQDTPGEAADEPAATEAAAKASTEAAAKPSTEATAKPAAARERKPAARRGSRAKRGTTAGGSERSAPR
jgi:hypothetical protein